MQHYEFDIYDVKMQENGIVEVRKIGVKTFYDYEDQRRKCLSMGFLL